MKRPVILLSILLSALLTSLTMPCSASGNESVPDATVGIAGGPMLSLAPSGDAQESVYAGTGSGIYKSVYEEDIWTPVNTGLSSQYVYSVVVPVTGTSIYCTTKEGVFASTDSGSQWSAAGLKDYQTYSLSISAVSPTWFAAGTSVGVFTSTDSGSTWTTTATGPEFAYSVVIDPDDPTTVYAGSFGKGVYQSTDFGTSWAKTGTGPENVYRLAIDPDDTDTLYAATAEGLFKTTNSGDDWSTGGIVFADRPVYAIAVDPETPATLYAATDNGVYKTTDSAGSWSARTSGIAKEGTEGPFVREIAVHPDDPTIVYAGTYSGTSNDADIYRSTDSAGSWTQINRELSTTKVFSLAFDPSASSTVFAATGTLGVIKSTNSGLSWIEANESLLSTFVRCIAVNPDSADVYAGTGSGLFLSSDAGAAWSEASPNHDIYSIGVNPASSDMIYIGTNRGIFVSSDDGVSWTSLNNNLINPYVNEIVFDPEDTEIMYVATSGDGVFKTATGGEIWMAVNDGLGSLTVTSLDISSLNADLLFAGTESSGIFKTTDGGAEWESLSLDGGAESVNSIAVKPDDPDVVYAATTGQGLFRTTDGGDTWDIADASIADMTVYDVVIDPLNTQRVLAAVEGAVLVWTFNTPPDPPFAPSPADKAVNQPVTATLSWQGSDPDAGDTVTYKVYFGTDTNPKNNSAIAASVAEHDPGPLQLSRTYYWKIAALDSYNSETESDTWRFSTIISNPPYAPSDPSPADGAEDQPRTITLSWTGGDPDSEDTVSYDVYFGRQKAPPLAKRNSAEASFETGFMQGQATYYWKIVARDNSGLETVGDTWSFSTTLVPEECLAETVLGVDHEGLSVLTSFRDSHMLRTPEGRRLVKLYYQLSPAFCAVVRNNVLLKTATASFLTECISILENTGFDAYRRKSISRLYHNGLKLIDAYAAQAPPSLQEKIRSAQPALQDVKQAFTSLQ